MLIQLTYLFQHGYISKEIVTEERLLFFHFHFFFFSIKLVLLEVLQEQGLFFNTCQACGLHRNHSQVKDLEKGFYSFLVLISWQTVVSVYKHTSSQFLLQIFWGYSCSLNHICYLNFAISCGHMIIVKVQESYH